MSDVSVAIMAHPRRKRHVEGYLTDLLPDAEVVWDEHNDRWDTGRRAMLAHDGSSRHHLVVQDDAILCNHFLEGAELALEHVPDDSPASFYIGRSRPHGPAVARAVRRAILAGRHWLRMRGPIWGPAVAMPTARTREVVEACDDIRIPNYDTRMMSYLEQHGTKCYYTVPTLVNHRVGENNPSLVPGRGSSSARTAHVWIGDKDPRNLDWSTRPYCVDRVEDMWWDGPQGKQCSQCFTFSRDTRAAIEHAYKHFGNGGNGSRVAVHSRDPERKVDLDYLWQNLSMECRGDTPTFGGRREQPWLVLVWDEDDLQDVGDLPAICIEESKHWTEFADALGTAGIKLKIDR